MFSNYFNPVSQEIIDFKNTLNQNTIGFHVDCYVDDLFPELANTDIALIIAPENRGSLSLVEENSYLEFRKAFYSLFRGSWKFRISDFGNLRIGSEIKDTYFALNDIVSNLLSQSVFPIIVGGTNDLIYPIYQAYSSFSKGVNLLCVDAQFDLIDADIKKLNSKNFVGSIIKQEPNHLSHFINLGYQSYLCQNDEKHLLEKMLFESCRLGDLRENIRESEPYLRNSDIISIDLSSIKQSDAPGSSFPSPNGLDAHHACVISRYAGMSDRVSSLGFFELNTSLDFQHQTTRLIGQMIWYFLEGFSLRSNDYPSQNTITTQYKKYYVPIKESDLQFIFYKSNATGRWWVSSSIDMEKKPNYRENIIPCSYEDYLQTSSGEMPTRIYRIIKSLK